MPGQKSKAKQVASLGESPAEARLRMQPSGTAPTAPAATGPPGPRHIAAMREQEGFGVAAASEDAVVEERAGDEAAPSPSKAMAVIRQLGQDKIQLMAERDSALNLVEQYRRQFGDLD